MIEYWYSESLESWLVWTPSEDLHVFNTKEEVLKEYPLAVHCPIMED